MLAGVLGAAAPEPARAMAGSGRAIYRWVCEPLVMVNTCEPANSPLT